MKNYKLKVDTMSESDLQKVYRYSSCPREIFLTTNEGFVNIDNGEEGVLIGLAFT